MMTKGPGGRFCDEVDLTFLPRPRSYEDIQVFDASRSVVKRLFEHVGDLGGEDQVQLPSTAGGTTTRLAARVVP
jgi:hypothetical protein